VAHTRPMALATILGAPLSAASKYYAVVGKFSGEGTDVFELPSLSKIGTTDTLGSWSEALLQVPGSCTIVSGSDTCCDGTPVPEVPEMGYTQECAEKCSVRTAEILITADGGIAATGTGMTSGLGEGPDKIDYDPSGKLLVANMGGNPHPPADHSNEMGGNIGVITLDADNTVSLSSSAVASPVLAYSSHGHSLSYWGCGKALMVDCGSFDFATITTVLGESAIRIVNTATGEIEASVTLPFRTREIAIHPTLPVVYTLYEMMGLIGVWTFPTCDAWSPSAVKEIARVPTKPQGQDGISLPSRLSISPDGKYAYSCARFNFPMEVYPGGSLGSFAVSTSGNLTAVSWAEATGANPRECALTPDGKTFVVTEFNGGTLSAYDVGAGGKMTLTKTVDAINAPNALYIYAPPDKCFTAPKKKFGWFKVMKPSEKLTSGEASIIGMALTVVGLVAAVMLALRKFAAPTPPLN